MRIHYLVIVVMSLAMSGCKVADPPEVISPKPLISIDCTESGLGELRAGFVLDWIADMAEENGGTLLVELRGEKRDIEFVFQTGDRNGFGIEIDYPFVEFRREGIFMNDELLSIEAFDDVLSAYMESAKIVEAKPTLLIAGSRLITIKDCMDNFDRLYEHGFRRLVLPGEDFLMESISGQAKSLSGGGAEP